MTLDEKLEVCRRLVEAGAVDREVREFWERGVTEEDSRVLLRAAEAGHFRPARQRFFERQRGALREENKYFEDVAEIASALLGRRVEFREITNSSRSYSPTFWAAIQADWRAARSTEER